MRKKFLAATAAALVVPLATAALLPAKVSAAVLTNGDLSIGVFDNATLGEAGVGVAIASVGDAIVPGCLCEGWGAAANGTGVWGYGSGPDSGLTSAALTGVTAATAISTVNTAVGLSVVHSFSPVAGGELFRIDITLTNTSASPATDVRYARTLDWDVPPGHFSDDFTTTNGGALSVGPGNRVFHTSSNPFDVPDPMVTRSQDANTNINDEPGDLGSYFIFSFGDLLAGESKTFTTFIGGALSTAALLNAFAAQNVEAFSYTYDDDGTATFGYGFTGLGIPPVIGEPPVGEVPAPGALGLLGLGIAGLALRRRKS